MLPLQGAQVWSLAGKLRSQMLCSQNTRKKKKKKTKQTNKRVNFKQTNGFFGRFEPPDCKPSKAPRPKVCSCTWWFLLFFCLVKVSAQMCPISYEQLPDSWNNLWLMSPRRVCISAQPPALIGFPGSSKGEKSACNLGDPGSIPGSERYPGEGSGNPL